MKCSNCKYGLYNYSEVYETGFYTCLIDHALVPDDIANDDTYECDLYVEDLADGNQA